MLGAQMSTAGRVARRMAGQSARPAGEAGSGSERSSEVVQPVALARRNISASSRSPLAYINRTRGG